MVVIIFVTYQVYGSVLKSKENLNVDCLGRDDLHIDILYYHKFAFDSPKMSLAHFAHLPMTYKHRGTLPFENNECFMAPCKIYGTAVSESTKLHLKSGYLVNPL